MVSRWTWTGPVAQHARTGSIWRSGADRPHQSGRSRDAVAAAAPEGFLLPHYRTFTGIVNLVSRVYSFRWDEAMRHYPANAQAMRRDAYFTALLNERIYPLTHWTWQIQRVGSGRADDDPIRDMLTRVVERTADFDDLRENLGECIWYGRQASQVIWRHDTDGLVTIADHEPVMGDKIHRDFDGHWLVSVDPAFAVDYGAVYFDRGHALLRLDQPELRDRFIVARFKPEDADYFDPLAAGRVAGVGLRDKAYWAWWLRDEMLSWATDFMEKVGSLGILIFHYDQHNKESKARAEASARQVGNQNALAVPVPSNDPRCGSVDLIPANMTGVQFLTDFIGRYFEGHIERLFVGQTLSAGTEGSGLGGTGVAALHANTKYHILAYDARKIAQTLTRDLLGPALRLNAPGHTGHHYRLVFNVPDPSAGEKFQQALEAAAAGVEVRKDELRAWVGLSRPDDDDDIVGGESHKEKPVEEPPAPDGLSTPAEPADLVGLALRPGSVWQYAASRTPQRRAPKGGITIGGKPFEGGQFIYGKDWDRATEAEKRAYRQAKRAERRAQRSRPPRSGSGADRPRGRSKLRSVDGRRAMSAQEWVRQGGWAQTQSRSATHLHYDPADQSLTVRFRRDGTIYRYTDVSPERAAAIANAASIGRQVAAELVHNKKQAYTKDFERAVLDPAITPPSIRRAMTAQGEGKSDKELAAIFSELLVSKQKWSPGYAQQAVAAMLASIPRDQSGRPEWTTDRAALLEPVIAMALGRGYLHHGGTGAADITSGRQTYRTADGYTVVLGLDTKASRGQTSSYSQNAGAVDQKAAFVEAGLNAGELDEPDEYAQKGLASKPRMLVYLAGVDVTRRGKPYGFAYFRAVPGGGGYTQFKAKTDIEFRHQNGTVVHIDKGKPVPPEVLSAATPKQRAEWGFNPLKHALPVKIQGLQSPEDFVVNPMLMQQLHDHLEGYVGSINYADYCKATGVKLGEHADRGLVAAAKQRARSARLQGDEEPADDITRLGAAIEKRDKTIDRERKAKKKLRAAEKTLRAELKERDQREELFRRALQGDKAARRELKAMGLL